MIENSEPATDIADLPPVTFSVDKADDAQQGSGANFLLRWGPSRVGKWVVARAFDVAALDLVSMAPARVDRQPVSVRRCRFAAHTVSAVAVNTTPAIMIAVHPLNVHRTPAMDDPIAPPMKLPTTMAVFRRLREVPGSDRSRVWLSTSVACAAMSRMMITTMSAMIEPCASHAATRDRPSRARAAPVPGTDQPRSFNTPARRAAKAPASPASPTSPIWVTE